jgi:hypothetical protein
MLKTVMLSSGRQRHYDYEGVLMTQIIDETGHYKRSRQWRQNLFLDGLRHFLGLALLCRDFDYACKHERTPFVG